MNKWMIPVLAGAAILGFIAGRGIRGSGEPAQISIPSRQAQPIAAVPAPRDSSPASEAVSGRNASASDSVPAPHDRSPRAYLLEKCFGYLEEEKLYELLWTVAYDNPKLQREVFEILKATNDPELMLLCQNLPLGYKNPALLKEILGAFQVEKSEQRKLAWGGLIASNWQDDLVRQFVFDQLESGDPTLQERMLGRISLQQSSNAVPPEQMERLASRLRLLVQAGSPDSLRAAAAGSLAGSVRTQDIQLLIETALHDQNSEVQLRAFWSLPSHSRSPSPMLGEQLRAMYMIAVDDARAGKLRMDAAERALHYVSPMMKEGSGLNDAEKAALSAILAKKK